MALLKQSTARDRLIFMVDSTDHVTGKTGLTLTITSSKNGAGFAAITPTVTERGNGFYLLALTAAMTDTLGDFGLHITGTGADATDIVDQVVGELPGALTASERNSTADTFNQRQITEGYAADGVAPTVEQALSMIWSKLAEMAISGTTMTCRKLDGSTVSMTFNLNDATNPTSISRLT